MKPKLPDEMDTPPYTDKSGPNQLEWWQAWPAEREFRAIYLNNSNPVDWEYFAGLKYFTAHDGIMFMFGLNPAVHRPGVPVGSMVPRKPVGADTFFMTAQNAVTQAESERRDNWTASSLLEWADARGLPVHEKFREIANTPRTTSKIVKNNFLAEIPGRVPSNAIGRLAVAAAWRLEREEGRRASAREVMKTLQEQAEDGSEPDVLRKAAWDKGGVVWVTSKSVDKIYTIEACKKTLDTWWKSRG